MARSKNRGSQHPAGGSRWRALERARAWWGFFAVLSVRYRRRRRRLSELTPPCAPIPSGHARCSFEAVNRLPKIESVRNFERLEKLDEKPGDVLLLLDVKVPVFNEGSGRGLRWKASPSPTGSLPAVAWSLPWIPSPAPGTPRISSANPPAKCDRRVGGGTCQEQEKARKAEEKR